MGIRIMRGWDDDRHDDPMDRSMLFSGSRDWPDPETPDRQAVLSTTRDIETHASSPDPNPENFRIERVQAVGTYIAAVVHYPGCTTFEGKKVLVLCGIAADELTDIRLLDPHFSEQSPVVARFKPDDEGWEDAMNYMRHKSSDKG